MVAFAADCTCCLVSVAIVIVTWSDELKRQVNNFMEQESKEDFLIYHPNLEGSNASRKRHSSHILTSKQSWLCHAIQLPQ